MGKPNMFQSGHKVSLETREKIRRALTGKKYLYKPRPNAKGRSVWNKGLKMNEEQKVNSGRKKGSTPWNKGHGKFKKICPQCGGVKANAYAVVCRKCTEIRAWNKGVKVPAITGDKHIWWKGDSASYRAKHNEIVRIKGKATKCNMCGETQKRIHWANIDHKYRRDPEDYIELCAQCHKTYDLKHNNSQ